MELKEDEYFIADLIGVKVFLDTDENTEFGEITDVLQTGANDVYEIKMTSGKSVLIPAIKDCIKAVDINENKMVIHLLDGLLGE